MGRNSVRVCRAFLLAVTLSACENSNTLVLEPNPAVRVEIDASNCPLVRRCGRCTLEFGAFDKNSQPAPFPTLIWTSSNPGVASVQGNADGTGRVEGWTDGIVTIRVEVLETGASDEIELQVAPPLTPVSCTAPAALGPDLAG